MSTIISLTFDLFDLLTIIDNAIDEWGLRMCAGKRRTLRATIVTIFSHMTTDVSVFVECDTFFRLLLEITANSNF